MEEGFTNYKSWSQEMIVKIIDSLWSIDQLKLFHLLANKIAPGGFLLASSIYAGPVGSAIYQVIKLITDSSWTPKLNQGTIRMHKNLIENSWIDLPVKQNKGDFYKKNFLDKNSQLQIVECKSETIKTYFTKDYLNGFINVLISPAAYGSLPGSEFDSFHDAAYNAFLMACEKVPSAADSEIMICAQTEFITFVAKKQ